MFLPIYPRLVDIFEEKSVVYDTFSNLSLEELARVKSDLLREQLIDKVIEKEWKSKTIRTQATKLNKISNYIFIF